VAAAARAAGQGLIERLQARREEIEQTLLTRVYAISDPREVEDPDYALGLRVAVSTALDYGLEVLAEGERHGGPPPPELLAQARQAARNGVGLDTVLRRYVAGHTLLDDFIVQEAEAVRGSRPLAQNTLRVQAVLLDRLLIAVADEYNAEREARARSHLRRPAECVRRLLAGELVDASELAYDLSGWHVGVLASGAGAGKALRQLAGQLDRQLLAVPAGEELLWAWLGGVRRPSPEQLGSLGESELPAKLRLSLGEPAQGLDGWRLTHRQAAAALPIARQRPGSPTRYGEVALLASMLQDEVLARSLQDLYLAPLTAERDGGEALRQTLRAYFQADLNSSSASAALGITRQTVNNRLRTVEERLGRPLRLCASELEAALRLDEYRSERDDFPVWQNHHPLSAQIG
jgi:hypothetical protein